MTRDELQNRTTVNIITAATLPNNRFYYCLKARS